MPIVDMSCVFQFAYFNYEKNDKKTRETRECYHNVRIALLLKTVNKKTVWKDNFAQLGFCKVNLAYRSCTAVVENNPNCNVL